MALFEHQDEDRNRYRPLGGNYVQDGTNKCPNCGRARVMLCQDGKRHCEKCWWCVEDGEYAGSWWDRHARRVVIEPW